ncbi:hypothetical protein ACFOEE_18370 [Pseudoalteromonas fenneropenaei]|uniref:Uncharacterized protein n=1 Tax=Pseudoalteromonas fenneropenaei TaxID=1737459 RepID=A0ABV7CPI1_9GAMM
MTKIKNINKEKPKIYTVEILASFELQLVHQFSDTDIKNAGGSVNDTFDDLIQEVEESFSYSSISVCFESPKRRRKDGKYKLSGNITRCYEFPEGSVDLLEGELVDGTFDNQLNDMKLAVEDVCNNSGYEFTIVYFDWADDEIIEVN